MTTLQGMSGEGVAELRAQVESLAPAPGARPARRGRRSGAEATPTLSTVSEAYMNAAMAMQDADVTPTAEEVAACARARAAAAPVMRKWEALAGLRLQQLNARRRGAGLPPIHR